MPYNIIVPSSRQDVSRDPVVLLLPFHPRPPLICFIRDPDARSVDGDEYEADDDEDKCECHCWAEDVCAQGIDPPDVDEVVVFERCGGDAFCARGDGVVERLPGCEAVDCRGDLVIAADNWG